MSYEFVNPNLAVIKVVGVGGAGNNAINRMAECNIEGCEFWALNTDYQVLSKTLTDNRILLGEDVTHGLGAGAHPNVGKQAAEASADAIKAALRDADMVFITAGMGGGTGTGAAPIVAKIAKDLGCLTIGIVTRPFLFEGRTRNQNAVEGLQALRPNVDSLIVISNDQLMKTMGGEKITDAFGAADNILCNSVKTITDLILKPSLINLDFADVRTVMEDKGTAIIGMGEGHGEDKAREAATAAVSSNLLESSIKGAKNAIVNVIGGQDMTLLDANEVIDIIREAVGNQDINIIFGVTTDESLVDTIKVMVIATEFIGGDLHNIQDFEVENITLENLDLDTEEIHNAITGEVEIIEGPIEVEEEPKQEETEEVTEVEEEHKFLPKFFRKRR